MKSARTAKKPEKNVKAKGDPAAEGSVLKAEHVVLIGAAMLLPAVAIYYRAGPTTATFLSGWAAATSLLAAFFTYMDKRKAQQAEWRTPEAAMHLLELLGGWPGAFLAQRIFRHKSSKVSYQVVVFLIIGLYQWVAIDALRGWPTAGKVLQAIKDF